MSRQIQLRRGTDDEHRTFTGAVGELTMDTTNNTLRLHDGVTAGGITMARADDIQSTSPIPDTADYVIETQRPTAENNYTWYRKYKSGWVEQGGCTNAQTITFPIQMQDTNYFASLCGDCSQTNNNITVLGCRNRTTTGFFIQGNVVNNCGGSSGANASVKYWRVSGFAM